VIWLATTAQAVTDEVGQVISYEGRIQALQDKTAIAQRDSHRRRLRRLLISLFPKVIAKRFIRDPQNQCVGAFPQTTLLSIVIVDADGFEPADPVMLIDRVNQVMQCLETTAERHGIEYVRSLGTTFLVAAGVPTPQRDHADRIVQFALDLQSQTLPLPMRMAIHSGPIVAGIVGGEQRLSYELYGPPCTIVQQLTHQGKPAQILVSAATRQALMGNYGFQTHATGLLESYWLRA
jgi:adenylate cyclase